MFMGKYNNSIDAKNRMIIPSKHRDQLGGRCVVTKGMDACLYIYPATEWDKLAEKVSALPESDENVRMYIRETFSNAEYCEIDKQGRILIPANLKEKAFIDKELVTVGAMKKIEIWSKEVWDNPENYKEEIDNSYISALTKYNFERENEEVNMEFKHVSVLLEECIDNLNIKPDGIYVDGTLGGGGHSSYICQHLSPEGTLIGIDRDQDALRAASERLKDYPCQKIFVQSNYSDIRNVLQELELEGIDGALLDLGVSSFQLDNAERGFSYMHDAPLDMRMNQDDPFTAHDVVNTYDQKELTRIISKYGEEKWASRIATFIVKGREDGPIETTGELVELIKAAIPAKARREGPHPAKRTFQAIRIEVNDELGQLEHAIEEFCDVLNPEGRLCVISFHSLEDRIVKEIIARRVNPCTCPKEFPVCVCGKVADIKKISKKPILPSDEELEVNPRSRSAKLRVCEKL